MPTRERAWETLTRYTKSEALLRHALAVEAAVRAYARRYGEDEELWGVTALLHDFDYEIHPTLDKHPQDGAPILRAEGYPEVVVEAILSHAEHLAMPRDTLLKKTKQPSFAAGVHREEVYRGAEELGVDLDEHIAFVIAALRPIAPQLGLRTAASAGQRVQVEGAAAD